MGGRRQDLAVTYHNLSGLRARQDRFEEAERLYQTSVTLHEQVLGARNRYLIPALEGYAYFLFATNRPEEAQLLVERSNDIRAQHRLREVSRADVETRELSCGEKT